MQQVLAIENTQNQRLRMFDNFWTSFYAAGLILLLWNLWPGACLASLQVHCLSTYLLVPRKQLKLLIQLHLWQFTQDSTVQLQSELLVQQPSWQLHARFNCPLASASSFPFLAVNLTPNKFLYVWLLIFYHFIAIGFPDPGMLFSWEKTIWRGNSPFWRPQLPISPLFSAVYCILGMS